MGVSLAPGTRLGPYEVAVLLGAGGMGEVYRAKDTRLGRTVAIKVLPPEFASDPERKHRFEQEARAVSALNHPNICALYDVGSAAVPGADQVEYLVMEFLDGQSLADRIAKGPLPLREALEYAAQIADALSKAHRQGVIHRDIKPGNVILTKEGAKLLDFGLAKARPAAGGADAGATLSIGSSPVTRAGFVSGTVPYMAPEQLEGRETDARTDIFAFGAMLYEMLSGRRAFAGESQASVIAAIMTADPPPLSERQPVTPPAVERLVRQCLAKDPDKRWQSAGDIARHLEGLLEEMRFPSATGRVPVTAVSTRSRAGRAAFLVGGVLVVAALGAVAFFAGKRASFRPLPAFHRLTFRRGTVASAAFTPEGQSVVYSARWEGGPLQVFTARTDGVDSVLRDGLEGSKVLAISPGNELALLTFQTLATAPLVSGAPREVINGVRSADWSPDGTALAVVRGGAIEYPSGTVIVRRDPNRRTFSGLSVSPRGDHLAFFEQSLGHGYVVMVDRAGHPVARSAFHDGLLGVTAWTPSGREVWFTMDGEAVRALDLAGGERSVLRSPNLTLADISRSGRALLVSRNTGMSLVGKPSDAEPERDLTYYGYTIADDLSPDGRTILFTEGGESDPTNGWSLFLRGMDGSAPVRLGEGYGGRLSPDGKWVAALMADKKGTPQIVVTPTGPGGRRRITMAKDGEYGVVGWLPDSSGVIFLDNTEGMRGMRGMLALLDGSPPKPITPPGWWVGRASPDGRHVVAENPEDVPHVLYLYAIDGSEKIPLPIDASQWGIIGFQDTGHLLVGSASELATERSGALRLPRRIYRLDIKTGKAELWKEIGGQLPRAGLVGTARITFSADGKSYIYNYTTDLGTLYIADGLR